MVDNPVIYIILAIFRIKIIIKIKIFMIEYINKKLKFLERKFLNIIYNYIYCKY